MQPSIFGKTPSVKKVRKKKSLLKKETLASLEVASSTEKIFTVSEFLDFVNAILGHETFFVSGELSEFKDHSSGCFFSLKDKNDGSVMPCYMPIWIFRRLGIPLADGMEVKVSGHANVYKLKGRFSFVAESLELVGEGTLKKAYEMLKKKLEAEGLFERKRALPEFIHRVGIITSKSGAVIDDFRKNLSALGFSLNLFDVRVEGVRAVEDILHALHWFEKHSGEFDVLVLMRGGGSLEDLQAFNHEEVARMIFASKIPTICAIGHDRDVPIAALVGDAAPSTPTAAAVLINNSWGRLERDMPDLARRLQYAFESLLADVRSRIAISIGALTGKLREILVRYGHLARLLLDRFEAWLTTVKELVVRAERYLVAVSPERNLKLGYSIITSEGGKVIRSAEELSVGEVITAKLFKGEINAKVEKINPTNHE